MRAARRFQDGDGRDGKLGFVIAGGPERGALCVVRCPAWCCLACDSQLKLVDLQVLIFRSFV